MSESKNIVLGVSGSIAAHKAIDLASQLTKESHGVDVVLTRDAQEFVNSLPFRTLTRRPVVTSLYDEDETGVTHIRFADNADLMLVAPATANTIAKLANGFADDALGCVALALNPGVPVLVAVVENVRLRNPEIAPFFFHFLDILVQVDIVFQFLILEFVYGMVVLQIFVQLVLITIIQSHHHGKH